MISNNFGVRSIDWLIDWPINRSFETISGTKTAINPLAQRSQHCAAATQQVEFS